VLDGPAWRAAPSPFLFGLYAPLWRPALLAIHSVIWANSPMALSSALPVSSVWEV
jgi:hypothetical protein